MSTSRADTVTLERAGPVATVRFRWPPHNHFSTQALRALADVLERADQDATIRVIVLASAGRHFCVGADFAGDRNNPFDLYEQAARMFAVRKPMVAAVQGAAVGGGLGLALAADFRVVAPDSRLWANFVKLGIHPGFAITLTLPRAIGHQAAARILYTGQRLTGEQAVACGLADRLARDGDVYGAALALAADLAANAPLAVEATRATLRAGLVDAVRRQCTLEAGHQIRLRATADFAEGVRAVAERRPGNWHRE